MNDSHTQRKAKKDVPSKKPKVVKKDPRPGHGAFQPFYTTFIWIPVAVAIAAYCYLNPGLLADILDEWIGFSEHYDSAPVARPAVSIISADYPKRDAVVEAFKHSWQAYERDAMGDDEYHPLEQKGSNLTDAGGIGYMVVDVLDTMQIMKLEGEYQRARKWVEEKLSFERDAVFSTFETTIRVLGGLLSAHHLSGGDKIYLDKAIDLADRMMSVFDTASGLPLPAVNLARRKGYHTIDFPGKASIAELATLQLEFKYLTHLTGDEKYWDAVEHVMKTIKRARLPHGLASIFMNIDRAQYETTTIRLGARSDSFYEYLLKQYLQTNESEDFYREMYTDAMDSIHDHLIQKTRSNKMTYTSELIPENGANGELEWRLTPKQDHLVCFLGGNLMLGAIRVHANGKTVSVPPRPEELTEKGKRDWETGVELIRTCMHTHDTATGLSPEIVYFRVPSDGMDGYHSAPEDWYIKGAAVGEFPPYDARYMLRPETVESLFIAYRLTGDQRYRDHGWKIFQSIEKHCYVESGGYATILNVDENPARQEDKMETFFLSETLKYLYLLFSSSDVLPLNDIVFNTEAHPFPIINRRK